MSYGSFGFWGAYFGESIHVQRTNYKGWLNRSTRKGRQIDMEYFNLAMKYFEDRYEKVVFVVMSDDFWGAYLGGGTMVYFADFLSPNSSYLLQLTP
ncbi:FUT1 [Cordylochernes scorpioides]|uniref:L-Fucosyltransferase n=1 Tax=Cordylochernes scorpioides TaxID=51811 RepID=A0ABY6JZQ0_9ARAC|nr:FUT1 [Cordylochernes scorpioides]